MAPCVADELEVHDICGIRNWIFNRLLSQNSQVHFWTKMK